MKMRVTSARALLALVLVIVLALALAMLEHQASAAVAGPREQAIEEALLQQLQTTIQSSLNEIYGEKYSQFQCEAIVSINEKVTVSIEEREAAPVDAIHGAKYYEVTVGLIRLNKEYVELQLKNDTGAANYYLARYSKGKRPKSFSCRSN